VFDERILGDGEFVEEVWHATETPSAALLPLELVAAYLAQKSR
jgi:hypothetical protein